MPDSDQGVSLERYVIIPRTLIFLIHDHRILLIKGAPHKRLWPGLYNGIGGHIEQGEDVLSAAKRELLEETGLQIDDLWLCGTVMVDTGKTAGIGIFVLRGDDPYGEPISSPEGELEWIAFDKLNELPMVEDLPALLPKILAANRGQPPFSARSYYRNHQRLVVVFGV